MNCTSTNYNTPVLTRLEAQRSLDKTSHLAEVQSWDVSRREDVQIYQHTHSMQTVHTLQPFTADTEVHSQTRFLIDQVNCMVAYPFWHWQPGGIKHNYDSTRPYVGRMARTIHQPKPRRLSVQSRSSMQPEQEGMIQLFVTWCLPNWSALWFIHKQDFSQTRVNCMAAYLSPFRHRQHRLFRHVILCKLCITKINLCIFKWQTVYI